MQYGISQQQPNPCSFWKQLPSIFCSSTARPEQVNPFRLPAPQARHAPPGFSSGRELSPNYCVLTSLIIELTWASEDIAVIKI